MFGFLGFNASMGKRQKQEMVSSSGKRQKQEMVSSSGKSPTKNSKEIPVDVLIDIFSRLPLEAVARSRCVSKLWSSVLRHQDFTQLYLKDSSVKPRILFTFLDMGRRFFYSMPQDIDPDRDYSIPVSPYYQMHFPTGLGSPYGVSPSILGFICTQSRKPMICNPSTGEFISLPIATAKKHQTRTCFGYDPIGKIFKVLCVSDDYVCRVATLGKEKVSWRRVECSNPHQPLATTEICIGGIIYYLTKCMENVSPTGYTIVCFNVRSESYTFLGVDGFRIYRSALINYHGKLGILFQYRDVKNNNFGFELWVLEDADEAKWSKTVHILPYHWQHLVAEGNPNIVGMTIAGEIVLSDTFLLKPFYMYYFDTVKSDVLRMEIDFGTVAMKKKKPYYSRMIFPLINHVENVELMD
ncbi:F-box protein At3g47030-like [Capsella rubella]|uniref:F-box protein At3g47030-like n=1 Tax=Capsella rubella TaxID=81985 RepID=UPI000CD5A932|nr:F-box protein At3g47030-like [Capsella rubella]